MEEKKEDTRITLTPCSKSELEADILEYLSTFSYVKEKSDGDLKTDAGEGIY